jgi:hypothetical protein
LTSFKAVGMVASKLGILVGWSFYHHQGVGKSKVQRNLSHSRSSNPRSMHIFADYGAMNCPTPIPGSRYSARRAFMTSIRAARMAGTEDAMTAAVSSTSADRTTGMAPGIFMSRK